MEKKCICTICDKKFIPGFEVMLKSLLDSNPVISEKKEWDIIVLTNDLQEGDLYRAKALYNDISLQRIDTKKYEEINETLNKTIPEANGSYLKFEVFSLEEYDRVLFLDSDLLILQDISELLEMDCDFGACRDLLIEQFNSGVMSIGKKYLGEDKVNDLIELTKTQGPGEHADQDILNLYFKDYFEIPIYFNFLKTYYNYPFLHKFPIPQHFKILHYIIHKPWIPSQNMREIEIGSEGLNKLWWDCYNKLNIELVDKLQKKIYPVYFTCMDHFGEFIISLKSLITVTKPISDYIGQISIFCDSQDTLSEEQIKKLEEVVGDKQWSMNLTSKPMAWGGTHTIENELEAYEYISSMVNPWDVIMNFDSDAILISNTVMKNALINNVDFYGRPANVFFGDDPNEAIQFAQGSCYFVRSGFAPKMLKFYQDNKDAIIQKVCEITKYKPENLPPDVTIDLIAKSCGASIKYDDFMVEENKSIIHLEFTRHDFWKPFSEFIGVEPGKHDRYKDINISVRPINSKAHPIIGIGPGRCGTKSLSRILSSCNCIEMSHEKRRLSWKDGESNNKAIQRVSEDIREKLEDGIWCGDVAFYWLPHLSKIQEAVGKELKIICLHRDKRSNVKSWLEWCDGHSFCLPRDRIENLSFSGDNRYNSTIWKLWVPCFPELQEENAKKAWEKYWDVYVSEMDKITNAHHINMESLNNDKHLVTLYDFLEIEEKDRSYPETRKYHKS